MELELVENQNVHPMEYSDISKFQKWDEKSKYFLVEQKVYKNFSMEMSKHYDIPKLKMFHFGLLNQIKHFIYSWFYIA